MRDGEFAGPHLAGMPIDLDLGDDRDHRTRALGEGDAAAGQPTNASVGGNVTSNFFGDRSLTEYT
jgi:hypothetical protein